MAFWRQLTRGLRVLASRRAADRDVDDELQHYLEQSIDAHVARGLSPADARRLALRAIGDPVRVREQVRDYGWENVPLGVLTDLQFAWRMLRKTPVATAAIVTVLSIGSGAVTTVFSAMNSSVLRPLPHVASPDRLVGLRPARRDGTLAEQSSYERFAALRDRLTAIDGLAAWGRVSLSIAGEHGGTAVLGNMVTANYFDVLGVRPAHGRFFTADEAATSGADPVLVVSHAFWTSRLGAAPQAIGQRLVVNGHPFTLVGVASPGFHGIYTGMRFDAWVPVTMQPQLRPRSNLGSAAWLWLFGRLQDDVSLASAQHEVDAVMAALRAEAREPERPVSIVSMRLDPLTGLPNGEGGAILGFLALLLSAAAVVLVIACVNVASMLSARYADRAREMAVRAALGAGRARLLRQLLTEVFGLVSIGAAGGFLVAHFTTSSLERMALPGNIPVTLELTPDLRVLAFAIAVTTVAGLLFAVPATLQGARRDIVGHLRDGAAGSGARRSRWTRGLVAGQIALSLVLLITAGLFARALGHGARIEPGFDPDGVATMALDPESWGYDTARARELYRTLRTRVEEMPGVTAVTYASRLPLMMGSSRDEIVLEDGRRATIDYSSVDARYFDVMRMPLVEGRPIHSGDTGDALAVAVVNETFARREWPGQTALGRTFRFRDRPTMVVGVVRDAKYAALDEITPAFAYFPLAQIWQPSQVLLARTAFDERRAGQAIEDAVLRIDSRLPRPAAVSLRQATSLALFTRRLAAMVTAAMGTAGLLLAVVGLYGMMSSTAARRTRELCIRVALGATRRQVLALIVGDAFGLAGVGILLGLLLSLAASRLVAGWLFDLNPFDAPTFVAMSALLAFITLLAAYVPARRAADADPLQTLRAE